MTWRAVVVNTMTGAVVDRIPVSDFSWVRALSAGGDGRCVIPLDELTGYSIVQLRDISAHWKRTVVLEYNNQIVYAGLVRAREVQDRRLTLYLTDLWGLWARRGAWDHNAPNMELWEESYFSMTLGTLAKRAVQRGLTGPSAPDMDIPITLPADVSGGLARMYNGFRMEFVGDILEDLMDQGLNIDFRPRWVSGALNWEMRNDPNTNLWEWAVNTPLGGVSRFREESDGSRMTNNSRFVGEGSDTDTLIRSDRNSGSDLPLLDRIDARKHIANEDELWDLVQETLDKYQYPTVQYTFDVVASGDPKVSDLRLGDTARLWFWRDLWNSDGAHDRIITRLEGSLSELVTVTCQTTGGA